MKPISDIKKLRQLVIEEKSLIIYKKFKKEDLAGLTNKLLQSGINLMADIAQTSNLKLFKYFESSGVDIDLKNKTGHRPLLSSIMSENEDNPVFYYLVSKKVDLLTPLKNGNDPIALAALNGKAKMLEVLINLLDNRKNLELERNSRLTPLAWSIANNRANCVKVLLKEKVNFERESCSLNDNLLIDSGLISPIVYSAIKNKPEIFLILLDSYQHKYKNPTTKLTNLLKENMAQYSLEIRETLISFLQKHQLDQNIKEVKNHRKKIKI